MNDEHPLADVGVVVIGRNEAALLHECLQSIPTGVAATVYVDSGSTDGSLTIARSCGVDVIGLPADAPPSAARARNAGHRRLLELAPDVRFIQFIDGDCVLDAAWLLAAADAIRRDEKLGAVWGLRRERRPEASVYNRICDLEWRVPGVGETPYFGGDAMLRAQPLRDAGGYDDDVVCSEDQELSARIRQRGWRILRLDQTMTWHDARMTRFGQWWRRGVRRGTGYVQTWTRHRSRGDAKAIARILVWSVALPLAIIAAAPLTRGWSPLLLLLYPLRVLRIAASSSPPHRILWGAHCVASGFPYAWGLARECVRQRLRVQPRIIEYHLPPTPTPTRTAPVASLPEER